MVIASPISNPSTLAFPPNPSYWWRDRDGNVSILFSVFKLRYPCPMSIITQYFPCTYGLWVTDRPFMHDSRLELCSSTSVSLWCHWPLFQVSVFALVSCMQSTFGGPLRNFAPLSNLPLHPLSKVRNLYLKSSLFPSSARSFSPSQHTESDHV
jgi:hypothetical protein